MLVPLPAMKPNPKVNSTYKLKDFIGKDDEYIKLSNTGTIFVDINTLTNNFDLLKKVIDLKEIIQINCIDYESALFLEENLDNDIILSLVDDYENKDRSYIDVTKFTKHVFYIPMSYFMWGVKFKDICNIHCLRIKSYDTMSSINGDNILYKDTLEKIKEVLIEINSTDLTDLDKCILVSNYLQSKVQYVQDGFESYADKVYVIKASEEEVTREKVGSVQSIISENYGLCMAISNATTLLLNNPIFNVNIRSVYGDSHVWNVVTIDGKQYYIDNTWAITRNKNRMKEALKAISFSSEYLLFGKTTAMNIGHHNSQCYVNGELEQHDYCKEDINEHIKILSKKYSFENYEQKLRFESSIKQD